MSASATLCVLFALVVVSVGAGDDFPLNAGYHLPKLGMRSVPLEQVHSTLDLLEQTIDVTSNENGTVQLFSRLYLPTFSTSNAMCNNHTKIWYANLLKGELWALTMLDATGKLPDGILAGNFNARGQFGECLSVDVTLEQKLYPDLSPEALHFQGRYASVYTSAVVANDSSVPSVEENGAGLGSYIVVPSLLNIPLLSGFCVPSSCSADDLQEGLQQLVGDRLEAHVAHTATAGDTVDWQPADIVVIVLCVLVGCLMVVGTVLDLLHRHQQELILKETAVTSVVDSPNDRLPRMLHVTEPKPDQMRQPKFRAAGGYSQFFIAFSVYTNTVKLLDTTSGSDTLCCVHGIRFLSMTWVLIGHAIGMILGNAQNILNIADMARKFSFQPILNAYPSVDTFFLLSGLLLAYVFCRAYEKTKRFNLLLFYVHRYLRLTPPLAAVIAVSATWFTYLGEGPIWFNTFSIKQTCQHHWWVDLLYVQNWVDGVEEQCVGQGWYLANDMQMYVFSPLLLLPLVWRPLWGTVWLALVTVAFLAGRITDWALEDLPPTFLGLRPEIDQDRLNQVYQSTWSRAPVWLLGMALGYLLYRLRGKQVRLRAWQWLLGWAAAITLGMLVVYGLYSYQVPWQPMTRGVAVSYGGLHRFAWGLAVGWVIFACVTGYGGFINTLLSHPVFVPLSRLTYSTYLVHINVIEVYVSASKGTMYFDGIRITYFVLAQLMVSLAVAYVLYLTFEAPFIALDRLAFPPPKPKPRFDTAPRKQNDDAAKLT